MIDDRDEMDDALRQGLESIPVRPLRAEEFDARVLARVRLHQNWGENWYPRLMVAFACAAVLLILLLVGSRLMAPGGPLGPAIPVAADGTSPAPPKDFVARVGSWLFDQSVPHVPAPLAGSGREKHTGGLWATSGQ